MDLTVLGSAIVSIIIIVQDVVTCMMVLLLAFEVFVGRGEIVEVLGHLHRDDALLLLHLVAAVELCADRTPLERVADVDRSCDFCIVFVIVAVVIIIIICGLLHDRASDGRKIKRSHLTNITVKVLADGPQKVPLLPVLLVTLLA